MSKRFDPVSGNIFSVFFYYAVPSIIGMMMMASAAVIDGLFIGQYAGPVALASVNLTVPLTGLLYGIAMMFSVGGAARCGKYLGAGRKRNANGIFTQTIIFTAIVALLTSTTGIIYIRKLALILGANQILEKTVVEYLTIVLLFNIFPMAVVCLAYFLRLDNHPYLAAAAIGAGSLFNVLFDWIFVAEYHLDHRGAALGTGLSEMITFCILTIPFFLRKTRLQFQWQRKQLYEVFKTAWNGFAELSNEISAGILIFVFNWVIMKELGENGVAAFSVINYILLCGLLLSYGISDSLQPVVSKNYGASKPRRIRYFLIISSSSVLISGIMISLALIIAPDTIIMLFMGQGEKETIGLSVQFLSRIWPIFILSGINIVLSSYLTAMQRAFPSTLIAFSRGLILPLLFLVLIRTFTNYRGILIVLPLSELTTACIALYLLSRNSPGKLVESCKLKNHGKLAAI